MLGVRSIIVPAIGCGAALRTGLGAGAIIACAKGLGLGATCAPLSGGATEACVPMLRGPCCGSGSRAYATAGW
jgi:hypothetical protein